jgi:hypothetical protein
LSSDLCQQRREVLFQTAIEVLEFTHLLESSDETAHWSWMFEMYRQWHAFAFVLSEIYVRLPSQATDRAWTIANLMFQRWQQDGPPQGWVLWKPLSRLMERVTAKSANDISTGSPQKSLVSFLADSTHIRRSGPLSSQEQVPAVHLTPDRIPW